MSTRNTPSLCISDLSIRFDGARYDTVSAMNLTVMPGRTVALVGPSGAGKSVTCRAVMGLLPPSARTQGSVRLAGTELMGLTDRQMRVHRGRGIAMVFQDPVRSLNPTMRVGRQLVEALRAHRRATRTEATPLAVELLRQVQFAEPLRVMAAYPHELSGGMRQRVSIAIAVSQQPTALLADEPTAGLDAAGSEVIMRLLTAMRDRLGLGVLLVSHDTNVVTAYADDVVEIPGRRAAPTRANPIGERVASALPDADTPHPASCSPVRREGRPPSPVIQLTNVCHDYGPEQTHPALAGVSLTIQRAETLAVIGANGAGKSTLAHAIVGSLAPTSGEVTLQGRVQLIMQNPLSSLDPTWRIGRIVAEPLCGLGGWTRAQRHRRACEVLAVVGLDPAEWAGRRRRALSGGQAQLVAIARAIAPSPTLLILDEALASVDRATAERVIDVLHKLQQDLGIACLFIAHDLDLVRRLGGRVAVMDRGELRELQHSSDPTDRSSYGGLP